MRSLPVSSQKNIKNLMVFFYIFPKIISLLKLRKYREQIKIVSAQIDTPTYNKDLAIAISDILPKLNPESTRIYHYTNSGVASWYDFAKNIFIAAQKIGFPLKIQQVIPITTQEDPTKAQLPVYAVLSYQKITNLLSKYLPHW
jgi:dTDP-4-dehydrorhamnose reductase